MHNWETVTREHVLAVLDEYDKIGREVFLTRHGFGTEREYVLWHDGRSYDSKAVLGVAYGRASAQVARSDDFTGGKNGAVRILSDLDFTIAYIGDNDRPDGEGHVGDWVDISEVGVEAAREAWAVEARTALIHTAKRYRAVLTYKELASIVQSHTGIRTKQLTNHWIGDVLRRVSEECGRRNEPLLSSLCVNTSGSVGEGYAVAVRLVHGEAPADPDTHAASERLACYRFWDADLPSDGGRPALTAKLAGSRARQRKARLEAQPVGMCPTCNMALPATGVCDDCN
jgi:hypothetical protein